jgi:DNA repair protein RecO (recombination protein O)
LSSAVDTAICIRTVDYSDTSQIVTLFTKTHGKISAIAKGAKRKKSSFDGPIELFSYGQITFTDSITSKLATLTEFVQRPVFLPLRRKLYPMNCAMFAAELISAFTEENDPNADLFQTFTNFIEDVQSAENDNDSLSLLILFQITLLNQIGTGLMLKNCANCSSRFPTKWNRAYFSSSANGLICPDCDQAFTDKLNIQITAASALADLNMLRTADAVTKKNIEKILVYHFTELMHTPPKMAKHFV